MTTAEINSFLATATATPCARAYSDARKRALCSALRSAGWTCKRIARAVNVTPDWVLRSI